MAFISGPRQCGKTTLAKMMASSRSSSRYYNWDDIEFRRLWTKTPKGVIPGGPGLPILVLDELHKDKRWKRTLKGVYDTLERPCDILVTGSACLNVYQKGSDSLLGRYFHYRLSPFSLREMQRSDSRLPEKVGSPFSTNAMREDIEVAHDTLKRWISWLKELYFLFEIEPYSKRIARSLKKEGKIYMWDYSEVRDPGARFENLVAHHLLKACQFWTDTGEGDKEVLVAGADEALFYLV